ncbi:MAG TPA: EAL domain-containing protein [Steroidobacteraceae bacterium]|nr:EAL domain-containing protein [Steroidobacteraceae bacterium]
MEDRADEAAVDDRSNAQKSEPDMAPALALPGEAARLLTSLVGQLVGFVYRCRDDPQWTMEYVSEGFHALTGRQPEDLLGNRVCSYNDLIHPDDRARVGEYCATSKDEGARILVEYRICHLDGSVRWVSERAVRVYDRPTATWKWEGFIEDITELKRAEQELKEANARYQSIFENALEGIFQVTPEGRLLVANPAMARMFGYESPAELLAELRDIPRQLYVEPERRAEYRRQIESQGSVSNFEFQAFRKNGEVIWVSENAHVRRNEIDGSIYYEGTLEDITDRRVYQAQIERQANYDALTGLANRTLLNARLHQAISGAAERGGGIAVVFIDLDQFKFINDTYGHALGDGLLQSMADRLRSCVRDSDTVARQGGDEFVLLLQGYRPPDLAGVVQRLHAAIALPWRSGRREFHVTSSIGVAVYPGDGDSADVLLRNADAAMYKAKENGRNAVQFFTAELNHALVERLDIEHRLRGALARHQFLLHYQPRIDMDTGRVAGAEALLRWRVPQRGLVSPARFISVAEDTGLIVPIGRWVLHTACAQARAWQEAGLPPIVVSVNVSPRQFREGNIVETIAEALRVTGLDAHHLQIELTEGLAMHGAEKYVEMLGRIKALGVQIAVDDFGTGYSSLSYLKRFPVDQLKVDRSFVVDLATDPDDAVIVQAIIALGHKLNLRVVAEGVETTEQLEFLRQSGCDEMQGYLFGKPMIAADFAELLSSQDFGRYAQLRQA